MVADPNVIGPHRANNAFTRMSLRLVCRPDVGSGFLGGVQDSTGDGVLRMAFDCGGQSQNRLLIMPRQRRYLNLFSA